LTKREKNIYNFEITSFGTPYLKGDVPE